jgi:hypothetical protein
MQDEKKKHRAWGMEHGDKRQPPSPHGFGVPRRAEVGGQMVEER